MYLGVLLIYVGFILTTLSLLASGTWLGILYLYDKMATCEVEDLVPMFGEEYGKYQRRVPKWFPRLV